MTSLNHIQKADEPLSTPYELRDELAWSSLAPTDESNLRLVSLANSLCALILVAGLFGAESPAKAKSVIQPPPFTPLNPPPVELPASTDSDNSGQASSSNRQPEQPSTKPLPNLSIPTPAALNSINLIPLDRGSNPSPDESWNRQRLPLNPNHLPYDQTNRPVRLGDSAGDGTIPTINQGDLPKAYRNRRLNFSVKMVWTVAPDGSVHDLRVDRPSGYPELERFLADWIGHHGTFPASETGKRLYHVFEFRIE